MFLADISRYLVADFFFKSLVYFNSKCIGCKASYTKQKYLHFLQHNECVNNEKTQEQKHHIFSKLFSFSLNFTVKLELYLLLYVFLDEPGRNLWLSFVSPLAVRMEKPMLLSLIPVLKLLFFFLVLDATQKSKKQKKYYSTKILQNSGQCNDKEIYRWKMKVLAWYI